MRWDALSLHTLTFLWSCVHNISIYEGRIPLPSFLVRVRAPIHALGRRSLLDRQITPLVGDMDE